MRTGKFTSTEVRAWAEELAPSSVSSARSRASASGPRSERRWTRRFPRGRRRSSRPTTTRMPSWSPERSRTPSGRRPPRSTSSRRRTCRRVSRQLPRDSEDDGVSGDRGHVVITGTSTGIGAATTKALADQGFHVFAGVRRDEDAQAWDQRSKGEVTPRVIDVTDEKAISAAAATVTGAVGDRGLAGLVNNAGIGVPAPLELQPLADFRHQLEVNLFGPIAMVQAFLPLIRRGHGRIV